MVLSGLNELSPSFFRGAWIEIHSHPPGPGLVGQFVTKSHMLYCHSTQNYFSSPHF